MQEFFPKSDCVASSVVKAAAAGHSVKLTKNNIFELYPTAINYSLQLARSVYNPKSWDEFVEGRKLQVIYIPDHNIGETTKPEHQPIIDKFYQEVINKRSYYKSVPVYNIDRFGNRQSRNCSNELTDTTSTLKSIAFFGCSLTFGDCIEADDIYVNQVVDGLSAALNEPVLGYNLGQGGNSLDGIKLQFQSVTKLRSFNYAMFLLPTIDRFVVVEETTNGSVANFVYSDFSMNYKTCKIFNIVPTWNLNSYKKRYQDKIFATSTEEIINRAVDNITHILEIAQAKGIKPLFSSWDQETYSVIAAVLHTLVDNPDDYMIPMFIMNKDLDPLDFGIDGAHPAAVQHSDFATRVNTWLKNNKEKLK